MIKCLIINQLHIELGRNTYVSALNVNKKYPRKGYFILGSEDVIRTHDLPGMNRML